MLSSSASQDKEDTQRADGKAKPAGAIRNFFKKKKKNI